MTIKEAKAIDMVDYLASLGHQPQKVSGADYWYLSPLGKENTASFKVNRKLNVWKDWSSGERGGNLIDFGIKYHRCSVSDFLKMLDTPGKPLTQHHETKKSFSDADEDARKITIIRVKPIGSLPLIKYFRERRIADDIAHQYLKEIHYQQNGKNYYALGFQNDAGGYALRNAYVKAASAPNDSTFINNNAKELATFEGSFNFLSYKTMFHQQPEPHRNYLILNSTSFFEKNIPRMLSHERSFLYLDNDKAGDKFTQQALGLNNQKFSDERGLYQKHDDLNKWLMNIGKIPIQKMGHKH